MGKIKSFQIKSLSKDLVNKYPNVFTINFNENKELLNKFLEVKSKHLKNKVAGYLSTLVKIRERENE